MAIVTCLIIFVIGAFSFATIEDHESSIDKKIKQEIKQEKKVIKELKLRR